jgi:hypothetical protein
MVISEDTVANTKDDAGGAEQSRRYWQGPQYAPVSRWVDISGVSRSSTYVALGRGQLRAKKLGKTLLIDVPHGLAYLDSLPQAKIRPVA